jgi:glycine cleavage system aminomethyltransferase T/glycine/D-amino acid oxidase-like deaminating enzyme
LSIDETYVSMRQVLSERTMVDSLPAHASVVVIGGGIMGCSTLYHLAKMGVSDAILVERNKLTSGTTWHSAAQVRALRHSRNLTKMIQYSVDLYSQLEQETGQSVGWIQKGSLSIATQPDRLIHIKRQESLAHVYGIDANSISVGEACERWPLMNGEDVLGAVWSPDDGRVSPSDVCAALVKGAKAHGARIFEDTGVTGVQTRNGRVWAVETANGTIRCDAIAVCAGLWSREVGAMAGADVPALACEHFYLLTKPIDGIIGNMPTLSDHDSRLYIRDDSGGLLVGCFEPMGKPLRPERLDKHFEFELLPEDWDHFEPMMEKALHRLPVLADAPVRMLLNGPESFTPDGSFMLGETAETAGLFLGCGMNSVGIASGGGAGMNLAHCIVHGHTAYDLSEADAKRFAPVFNSLEHLMARAPEILGTHYDIAYPAKQLGTARQTRRSPLDEAFMKANAYTDQFYGWERPLYFNAVNKPRLTFGRPDWFDNVRQEVMAAHQHAAIFDLSTFGKIDVVGPDAEAFLLHTCAGHMSRGPGSVIYSAVLNPRGTFESDITAQRISSNHYRLFVGTTAIKRDLAWFSRAKLVSSHRIGNTGDSDVQLGLHSLEVAGELPANMSDQAAVSDAQLNTPEQTAVADFDVVISDVTEQFGALALMGPKAPSILRLLGGDLDSLGYFKHQTMTLAGIEVRAARMSYVGEAGCEITCDSSDVKKLYSALLKAGAKPAGLFAQTSMRIEKGFRAMGHELDSDVTPEESGLDGFIRKQGGFVGHRALRSKSSKTHSNNQIVSLLFHDNDAVPLGHEPLIVNSDIVGKTTSCSYGYRVEKPVALAQLSSAISEGACVDVDVAGKRFRATVSHLALFDPAGRRMKM